MSTSPENEILDLGQTHFTEYGDPIDTNFYNNNPYDDQHRMHQPHYFPPVPQMNNTTIPPGFTFVENPQMPGN